MANFNKVILLGNLTRDPELRYTPNGTAVAKISMAVNRQWRSESGENREETTFVDIDAFGKQAENIGQYMKKGRPLLVEGRLRQDQWEDKQTGQKRSKLVVVCESFRFVGGTGGAGGGGASREEGEAMSSGSVQTAPSTQEADTSSIEDDDVPF